MFSSLLTNAVRYWQIPEAPHLHSEIPKDVDLSRNGWVVGSYVNVLRRAQSFRSASTWQTQPALLMGIHKQELSNAQFTVVYLYDQKVVAQSLPMLGIYPRYGAMILS
jgi:hypothetical protein